MTVAIGVLQAIERLTALAGAERQPDPRALGAVQDVLRTMGLNNGATGYTAEKLQAVMEDFDCWYGARSAVSLDDPSVARAHLLRDIEHLKKALARWSEGQD